MKTQSETRNLFEARQDTSYQVAVVFSFKSDWLRGWRRFSGPITERVHCFRHSIESGSVSHFTVACGLWGEGGRGEDHDRIEMFKIWRGLFWMWPWL